MSALRGGQCPPDPHLCRLFAWRARPPSATLRLGLISRPTGTLPLVDCQSVAQLWVGVVEWGAGTGAGPGKAALDLLELQGCLGR